MLRVRDVATHFRVHPATVLSMDPPGLCLRAYRNGQPYQPGDGATGTLRIPESVLNSTDTPQPSTEVA